MALLAEDGTVQIARRGELNERPFSIAETRANRRQAAEKQLRGEVGNSLKTWKPGTSEDWTIADGGVNVAAPANRQNTAAPILLKANLSGQNTDDILFLDSATREIKILATQEPEKVNGEVVSFAGERSIYTMEAASTPAAVLAMKLNIFVRPGLVILQDGKAEPSFVPAAPPPTPFVVDRTDDTNIAAAQVCSAAANDCSLRGAITKANAAAGADVIMLSAGTYTLILANSGGTNEDSNNTGDLDILQDLTITGAGLATTIVQAGTTNANGIDKVFASNPVCTSAVSTSLSGMTVRFGRNTQANGAADFSFTGGGMDWCNTGTGGTLTVTNSTFDNNNVINGSGGGINFDTAFITSGSVSLTGVTISNNSVSDAVAGVSNPALGGGLRSGSGPYNVTITNSTILGNVSKVRNGGGISFTHNSNITSTFILSGVTISNNSSFSLGGGILFIGSGNHSFTLNQSSIVSGNTSGTGTTAANATAAGGGLYLDAANTSTALVTKSTITGNILSPPPTDNRGGAGIFAGSGPITVSFNRIVGNTGTTAALGTGLNKDLNAGTTNAVNNWWGCNTGPSAAPCDTAALTAGSSGSLSFNPWLRFTHTASPNSIVVGQGSTLTASFLTNSAGTAIAASNLDAFIWVPVTFNNAVRGTISAQTTIQASGTATATFTGTNVGAGSANATVDNSTVTSNIITIGQAAATTALSTSLTPTVFGQSVTFTATVSVTAPGAGTPTGTVQFQIDSVNFGAPVALSGGTATSGNTTTLTAGNHVITATYSGDTNFSASNKQYFIRRADG